MRNSSLCFLSTLKLLLGDLFSFMCTVEFKIHFLVIMSTSCIIDASKPRMATLNSTFSLVSPLNSLSSGLYLREWHHYCPFPCPSLKPGLHSSFSLLVFHHPTPPIKSFPTIDLFYVLNISQTLLHPLHDFSFSSFSPLGFLQWFSVFSGPSICCCLGLVSLAWHTACFSIWPSVPFMTQLLFLDISPSCNEVLVVL